MKTFSVCYEDSLYPYIEITGFKEGETKKAEKMIEDIKSALKFKRKYKIK